MNIAKLTVILEKNPMYKIVDNQRTWGMLCHISAIAGFVIPCGNIIGPLIVYSMKKDEFPFVADQGKESINFQISILIYLLGAFLLHIRVFGIMFVIAIPLLSFVLTVIASVRANDGEYCRYPLCIHFIK